MKTIARIAAIAALLFAFAAPVVAGEKATICHVPPGNPDNAHTITISVNALKAHLGENEQGLHGGDYYGECRKATPAPTASPTPTPAPTDAPRTTFTPRPTGSIGQPLTSEPRVTLPPTDTVDYPETTRPGFVVLIFLGALFAALYLIALRTTPRR